MKRAVLIMIVLGGCASPTETIYLARDGKRVQCGPYKDDFISNTGGAYGLERRLRQCVEDYQQAGYEQVAAP